MNNIEKCLDQFFKELKHTPGPWMRPETSSEVMTMPTGQWKICRLHAVSMADEGEHNGKLISAAPDMLRTLCRTYLLILVKFRYGISSTVNSIRLSMDATLADLNSRIHQATGVNSEEIQDTFEQYATWIHMEDPKLKCIR